jgi:uncharacterized protein YndB with AHSA1/START domain
LPAGPEAVFLAFTDSSELGAWFWPPRLKPTAEVDLHVGGRYAVRSQVSSLGVSGRCTAVAVNRSLAFDWTWDGEALTNEVTLGFEPNGRMTRLTVLHRGFEGAAQRDDHVTGWSDCLDRLETHLVSSRASAAPG